jgi:hypothetical protein
MAVHGEGGSVKAVLLLLTALVLFSTPAFAQGFSGGFNVGSGFPQGKTTGTTQQRRGGLPPVATSAVGLNIVEAGSYGGNWNSFGGWNGGDGGAFPGGGEGGGLPPGFPPSPGEGFQLMTQHGQPVGWYSPEEIALSQTDFPAALRSIVNSDRYYGGESGRRSILYEIGDIDSPF